jgi:hypothetical protein
MDVHGDHQIVAFGPDQMIMFDVATAAPIVDATRDPMTGEWIVSADGIGDVTIPPDEPGPTYRQAAIQAMVDHALATQPGTGFSCVVPHGLESMP